MNSSEDSDMESVTGDVDAYSRPINEDSGEWSKITPDEKTTPVKQAIATSTSTRGDDHVKRHGQNLRSCIRVDISGNSEEVEVDKFTIMQKGNLSARDLRLVEISMTYPTTIRPRENAIVLRLEQIGCIIMIDEVFFFKSKDNHVIVLEYVKKLQRRLQAKVPAAAAGGNVSHIAKRTDQLSKNRGIGGTTRSKEQTTLDSKMPFEFTCLDVILGVASTFLQRQAVELEAEAYPLFDQFTGYSKITKHSLEQIRGVKVKLVELTRTVSKVRDELEHLLDDDEDISLMYLTKRSEALHGQVSAKSQPVDTKEIQDLLEDYSQESVESQPIDTEEIQDLLEDYFVAITGTQNILASMREYADDTEDFINIQLDDIQNKLIRFTLVLLGMTSVLEICGLVTGTFSMQIRTSIHEDPGAFKWILIFTGVGGAVVFCLFMAYLKHRRLV